MHIPALAVGIGAALLASPALASAEATCLIGPHPGIHDADAETVAAIVCDNLRKAGVALGEPVEVETLGTETFRVSLRPLGRQLYVSLQRVDAAGAVVRGSELMLHEIEEAPVAAPRLVRAVLEDKPVEQTAAVDNLVGEETRQFRKKDGETLVGLGFLGIAIPGTDVVPGGGFTFRTMYETVDFAVLGDLRLVGGSPSDDSAVFFGLGVGARWFLSDQNWSPFLGAGMGWTALSVDVPGPNGSGTGLGAWAEVGIEALRFYESRLSIDARVELPMYELERAGYYVPITFGATYFW